MEQQWKCIFQIYKGQITPEIEVKVTAHRHNMKPLILNIYVKFQKDIPYRLHQFFFRYIKCR